MTALNRKPPPFRLTQPRIRYTFYTIMGFEYDLNKSNSNHEKHGIDFEEAQEMWNDPDRLVIPARCDDEERFAMLARLNGKIWAAFYTIRGQNTRIISVRRARKAEEALYEG